MHSLGFEAIGTRWELSTPRPIAPEILARIHAVIDEYDRTFSRFRPDSAVTALAAGAGEIEVPPYAGELFELYHRLGDLTGGAVNPLIGRSLEALGYDARYTLRPVGEPVAAPAFADFVELDGRVLRSEPGVLIDVGAAGKGQLVDLVAGVLASADSDADDAPLAGGAVVDAGGDMRVVGSLVQPLRVGLEDPADTGRVIGVVELNGGAGRSDGEWPALAGSAPNRRRWAGGMHHILDAATGLPIGDRAAMAAGSFGGTVATLPAASGLTRPNVSTRSSARPASVDAGSPRVAGSPMVNARPPLATWAMASSAMIADGATTALFFADPALVAAELGCAAMSFDADRRAIWSANFTVEDLS
ncbi:FAD:protein FMN transferase [Rarobacter faecitabidus]|uniref:FAD:protein FMN transferase n=1 Tax=Rarobacter faecitabidus TaxID=13243 RepID=A0A542ZP55_RARFA|nr:FAD:protein FMN transferase [Rarobacter faecitabidus]TQL62138.1 thiamine biosynthesis lipoprotein [Rarobacter faecitabidus]